MIIIIKINFEKVSKNKTKRIYTSKYSDEYYLQMIMYLLNDINHWSFLQNLKVYQSKFKNHYKTIYNKFRKWTELNVFKNAFEKFKNITTSNL